MTIYHYILSLKPWNDHEVKITSFNKKWTLLNKQVKRLRFYQFSLACLSVTAFIQVNAFESSWSFSFIVKYYPQSSCPSGHTSFANKSQLLKSLHYQSCILLKDIGIGIGLFQYYLHTSRLYKTFSRSFIENICTEMLKIKSCAYWDVKLDTHLWSQIGSILSCSAPNVPNWLIHLLEKKLWTIYKCFTKTFYC